MRSHAGPKASHGVREAPSTATQSSSSAEHTLTSPLAYHPSCLFALRDPCRRSLRTAPIGHNPPIHAVCAVMGVESKGRAPRLILNGVDDDDTEDGSAGLNFGLQDHTYETDRHLQRYREEQKKASSLGTASSSKAMDRQGEIDSRRDLAFSSTTESPPDDSRAHGTAVITSAVNPATVPIRTSSSKAVNGEKTASPESKREPRKHRSLASVPERDRTNGTGRPEVDERSWLAQSKMSNNTNRNTIGSPPTSSGKADPLDRASSHTQQLTLGGIGADLISGEDVGWSAEKENILKGPFDYLEGHPGKDIRSQLISAFNTWLRVPPESLQIITGVVKMLHTASLLIDDVEDNSQLRRGVPVAHSIFGTAQTINSANYVYFCALQDLAKLKNPEAIKIFTDELLNLHRGQGMDLFWRDTLTCPSEDDYLEMVGNKTGGLFRLAIKLMCCESPTNTTCKPHKPHKDSDTGEPVDYVPLVNTIGLLFQILDDYRNLSSPTYTSNKGLCEDLTEGKFSFPIIHAIRSDPANLVLINILKQKTQDDEVKRYAVAYMEKCGSFSYTRRVLRGLTRRAGEMVEEVDRGRGQSVGLAEVLEKLRVERHSRGAQSA